jgi:hypothetical protein
MLAMSTSPASAGTSSSTWATTGSLVPVVAEGSGLLSSGDAHGSPTSVACCACFGTTSSKAGAGLRLLSVAPPTVSHSSSSPWSAGSDDGISYDTSKFNCQHARVQDKYSTTLLEELTSWAVVSVTFNFLATRLCATLRGFFGGAGRLASKLVGLSLTRGLWGSVDSENLST